jgi:hypothetical protein
MQDGVAPEEEPGIAARQPLTLAEAPRPSPKAASVAPVRNSRRVRGLHVSLLMLTGMAPASALMSSSAWFVIRWTSGDLVGLLEAVCDALSQRLMPPGAMK